MTAHPSGVPPLAAPLHTPRSTAIAQASAHHRSRVIEETDVATIPRDGLRASASPPRRRSRSPSRRATRDDALPMLALPFRVGERYVATRVLGKGGMAVVVEALDRQTQARVALKMARSDVALSAWSTRKAIRNELAILERLDTDAVCRLVGSGEDPALGPYIALRRMWGRTLFERQARTMWDADHVSGWLVSLLTALSEVHAARVVHGDIKPSNVLVCPLPTGARRIVLFDFGLANCSELWQTMVSGLHMGTPGFFAPERLQGIVDARSDLFSVAATTLWCLGLAGDDHRRATPVSAQRYLRTMGVDQPTAGVIVACLDPDYRQRPRSCAEAIAALPSITGAAL